MRVLAICKKHGVVQPGDIYDVSFEEHHTSNGSTGDFIIQGKCPFCGQELTSERRTES